MSLEILDWVRVYILKCLYDRGDQFRQRIHTDSSMRGPEENNPSLSIQNGSAIGSGCSNQEWPRIIYKLEDGEDQRV